MLDHLLFNNNTFSINSSWRSVDQQVRNNNDRWSSILSLLLIRWYIMLYIMYNLCVSKQSSTTKESDLNAIHQRVPFFFFFLFVKFLNYFALVHLPTCMYQNAMCTTLRVCYRLISTSALSLKQIHTIDFETLLKVLTNIVVF